MPMSIVTMIHTMIQPIHFMPMPKNRETVFPHTWVRAAD